MLHTFPEMVFANRHNFAATKEWFDDELFHALVRAANSVDALVEQLRDHSRAEEIPAYVAELASMEGHLFKIAYELIPFHPFPEAQIINPTLELFSNNWKNLAEYLGGGKKSLRPDEGEEQVMIWQSPFATEAQVRPVTDRDLLILKMTVEALPPEQVAATARVPVAAINGAVRQGFDCGMILGPKSGIMRLQRNDLRQPDSVQGVLDPFAVSRGFALQWHITQACDLHCRHCYDRSPCDSLSLEQEISVLDSFYDFCREQHVFGQVSFTGGNPLLHPHFKRLYREASDRGFDIGILGNPALREDIADLMDVQPPAFYQMSLEGLEEHNDYIRGAGHYRRVFAFLDILREQGVYSKIMLTLTRDNMDQVIPLGRLLQPAADVFTFNRLSLVGEGADLVMADPAQFRLFLKAYAEAAREHSVFDMKDNLFNIVLDSNEVPLFGGCTGYGCGAAFNFVAVLATGEVHACRKFPSPIGDITKDSLSDIYHSSEAERYRKGPSQCNSCRLNSVCRGCLAATYSYGLDIFTEKDPYCFISDRNGT